MNKIEEAMSKPAPDPKIRNDKVVKFRVGQIVKHEKKDLYGVIFDWDEFRKQPSDVNVNTQQPFYKVMAFNFNMVIYGSYKTIIVFTWQQLLKAR